MLNASAFRPAAAVLAVALLFVAALVAAPKVSAGTTGSMSGVAVDAATNAPIAGAKITATSPSALQTTTTDKSGRFTFASLPPDTYTVSIEAAGYSNASIQGIEVVADNEIDVTVPASAAAAH